MKTSRLPHYPLLLAILSVLALAIFAQPAYAQSATAQPAASIESALQAHFGADSKAADAVALREAGYAFERLLVAEVLPSETTVFVEVELVRGDTRLRYPLKVERQVGQEKKSDADRRLWQVSWAPVEAYARGLVEVASDEGLVDVGSANGDASVTPWADVERLPAFSVIVGDSTLVTPFGRITNASDNDPKAAEQAVLKTLGEYAQRWVGLTLEDEPGTANVDLILGPKASWRRAMQALMPPASDGLFRTYLVGRAGGEVVALATVAPVVRQTEEGPAPLVVGMYREGDQHAFRIRVGEELVENEEACADEMSFCADSLEAFEQQASDQITAALEDKQTKLAYVMFAATGEVGAGVVARHLDALGRALGVPASKIFVGYIRKGEESKP